MASVVIAGDTSGTITLSAPAVAGSTTLTLPTTSGTIVSTANAQPGMTLLSNTTVSSGTTFTVSGLTLTGYKQIQIVWDATTGSTGYSLTIAGALLSNNVSKNASGMVIIDFATSLAFLNSNTSNNAPTTTLTNSSTSITVTVSTAWTAASKYVFYGVA